MNALVIKNLAKGFGHHQVIDGLNLSVPQGSVFGFIGQNGAGKTTTMKMVLGLLEADAGEITLFDQPVHYGQDNFSRTVGYLPDVPEFYNYMSPKQYLALCGEVLGMEKAALQERSVEVLQLVGLTGVEKRIGGFSRGMKQRLGIAQALLARPKLLICDEPTSALDPVGRKEILEILEEIKGTTTVLFSTHILSDVERVCDHVAILHGGKIAATGTLAQIRAQHGQSSLSLVFGNGEDLSAFKAYEPLADLMPAAREQGLQLLLQQENLQQVQRRVILALGDTGLCPRAIEFLEPSLEELFLEVIA